jgi:hypothetical protein
VARGEINGARVIYTPTGGQVFLLVGAIEGDQISNLFAFEIDDPEMLTAIQDERGARLRCELPADNISARKGRVAHLVAS